MAQIDKWLKAVKSAAGRRNVSLSSFSESRIKNMVGDIDGAIEELYTRSGCRLSDADKRELRKEIEKEMR